MRNLILLLLAALTSFSVSTTDLLTNQNSKVGGTKNSIVEKVQYNQQIQLVKEKLNETNWWIFKNMIDIESMNIFKNSNIVTIREEYRTKELTEENLQQALVDVGIQNPSWVLRQAKLESGNFKSNLCRKHNNIFGMRKPRNRDTYSKNERRLNYASFDYWIDSVLDYHIWQSMKPIKPGEKYGNYLRRRSYASDRLYHKKLENVKLLTSL